MGRLVMVPWGAREVALTRWFPAARAAVFAALTTPAATPWRTPRPDGWTMPVCEADLRVGGGYRYLWRHAASGREVGARGTYRAIVAGELLAFSERLDPAWYPGEAMATVVLTTENAGTMLRATALFESTAARDRVLAVPMAAAVAAAYDRLEALARDADRSAA